MSPEELVKRSQVIVRATALGYFRPPTLERAGRPEVPNSGAVRFRVDKVIKGRFDAATLDLDGRVIAKDDVNEAAVPYRVARKSHDSYVTGAEYLLMLREGVRGYDVTWASPSASNEPIRGENDAWLKWVSQRASKESH